MKIFLSFLQGRPDHPIPAYSFWEYYIKKGIEEAGHDWDECPTADWAEGLVPKTKEAQDKWRTKIWTDTVEWVKTHPVDLFLSYLYPEQIDGTAIKEIKRMGIPCINFFCDHVRMFSKIPKEFSVFDLNWVPEYKAIGMYQTAGLPHINLPMPMWVAPEHRVLKPEANNDIVFIGSKDIQRQLLFEEILGIQPELPIKIYGHGWMEEGGKVGGERQRVEGEGQKVKGEGQKLDDEREKIKDTSSLGSSPIRAWAGAQGAKYSGLDQLRFQYDFIKEQGLSAYIRKLQQRRFRPEPSEVLQSRLMGKPLFDDYIRLTQQSMITVGINRYPSFRHPLNKPDTYSRLRDLEAPMLGACYFTEWTNGIEQLYDIGTEIATFTDVKELVGNAKELIANKKRRMQLREKGQNRALCDHSISQSLKKILERIC